jgi:predicted permease
VRLFLRRLLLLLPWRRRAAEREMQEELRGVSAMADARELGNLTLAAERTRDEWGWTRLGQVWRDIRLAVRMLGKRPGFSAAAILSLALGIGANTALFTLINAVSWRLLPIRSPESLLLLRQRQPDGAMLALSFPQYALIRDHNGALDMAAYSPLKVNVAVGGQMEPPTDAQLVTGSYFPLLGVSAAAGRLLGPEDDRAPLAHPVAVISYGYWKRRWALDPAAIGSPLTISGTPFTIVGVTPPEFFGVEVGASPSVYVPVMMQPVAMPTVENRLDRPINMVGWLEVIARRKPDVSPAQADAMLARLAESNDTDWRMADKFGTGRIKATLVLTSAATGLADLRAQFSQPLRILLAVVAVVLLIACANAGSLMLARAAGRRPEFALRLALGAGRSRLIRQVLMEGLVLAAAAGALGVLLAYLGTRALVAYASTGRDAVFLDLTPDARVLAFTLAVSMLAGVCFALVPALRATRVDLTSAGRKDLGHTRHASGFLQPGRAFVVTQVALSLVLLMGAGVFVRSLQNLMGRQLDVDRARVLIVRVEPRGSDQRSVPGTVDRLDRIYRDLLAEVRAMPGVASATLARSMPLSPVGFSSTVATASGPPQSVTTLMIYPRYPETMGLPLVAGRDFDERDLVPGAPLVTMVNETFVREVLSASALGVQHGAVMLEPGRPPQRVPMNIVGVVKDSPYPNVREAVRPLVYQTFRQARTGRGQMVLYVRASGDPDRVIGGIRAAVQRIDPHVPTFDVHTLADEVDATLIRERLIVTLSAFFALFALVLVCVGLYSLTAFTVARRTAEFGVRVALGATRGAVTWMVVRQVVLMVAAGAAIGVPLAWAVARLASRALTGVLFQLTATDPLTMATSVAVLALVAVGAGWIPARRAATVDPIVALRTE